MKIRSVRTWKENLDLSKPYTIAYKTIDHVDNLFVTIELENGITGIGAGSPAEFVTGEKIEASAATLSACAEDLLCGRDIRHYKKLIREAAAQLPDSPAALAAIDIALHDAFAQFLGLPLADFLGRIYEGFPTSVTIGIQSLEQTLEDARAFQADGFRVIKLKTGLEAERDIETFARLRETVGPEMVIRIDANQGYSRADLLRFVEGTQHLNVEFFEQPFPPGQLDEMLLLPEDLRRLCAADEDLHSMEDAVQMAHRPQPYGIYNIKLMKCGGVDHALKIAEAAELAGIDLMWGCNDESIVSITAALHAALACPNTRYIDLDGSFDLARDIVKGGFVLREGFLYANDKPGLGLVL
ncbi:MAG: dipeptide epimerase [Saprospiraceae bacterium]|nr:dipeptide epimerase [Saprospiraceae bacterium]